MDGMKLVEFEKYCKKCEHSNVSASNEPCNHCLSVPARQYSHKPECYLNTSEKSVESACKCNKSG